MNAAPSTNGLLEPPELDIDPFSSEILADPYPFFEAMREAGPVVFIKPHGYYAVGRYQEVGIVSSDSERFTSTGGVGLSDIRQPGAWRAQSPIAEVDPPDHTAVRATLQKILSPLVVRNWREVFEREAQVVAEEVVASGDVDGVKDIAERFVLKVFPEVFGVDVPTGNLTMTGELNFNQLGPNNDRLKDAMKQAEPFMTWYSDALQRRNMLPGGFGEKIYLAEDEGGFSKGSAPFHVRSFFRAGVDTTISGIGSTLNLLASHPEQFRIVKEDPSKIKNAFEEAIRLESPAQVMFRTTTKEVELSGYRLRSDTKVGFYMGAANRDPRQWEAPEKFDVMRKTLGIHRAFGFGGHVCIGQMIARLEADCILGAIISRIGSMTPNGNSTYKLVNTLRTLRSLPLRLT